ncbi:hypothetical protein ACFQV7_13065 [Leucobacter soli]
MPGSCEVCGIATVAASPAVVAGITVVAAEVAAAAPEICGT